MIGRLPDGCVLTDPDVTETYRQDWARDPAAGKPLAVVRASCTEDVQEVMRWASTHRVPVVPRGAGSGLSGGATALDGSVVLCTEKMRTITVDPVTRTAVVQPGLLNAEVKAAAAEHGLWYPPDPSSFEMCSIGGNTATNAGGLCCVKYGVTTDYVLGMQVVLADGTAVRLGGPRLKDVAGPVADQAVRRQRGHAGGHHGDHAAPDSRATGADDGGCDVLVAAVLRGRHSRDHPCPTAVDARVHGPHRDQRRRGRDEDGTRP